MNARTKEKREAKQLVYVADGVTDLYLSKSACRALGIVSKWFPNVADVHTGRGYQNRKYENESSIAVVDEGNDTSPEVDEIEDSKSNLQDSEVSGNASNTAGTVVDVVNKSVKYDKKGRPLAPCGCLLRTLPPDIL